MRTVLKLGFANFTKKAHQDNCANLPIHAVLFPQSCLLRSSQPASGITTKRCKEDEKLLNETLSSDSKGLIFDTRNTTSVYNGKTKGMT